MKHGHNIISENLSAFCLGALGGFGLSVKHIFLDVTGGMGWDFLTALGVYALKALMTAITTAISGLVTAWVSDMYKNYKNYRKSKKDKKPFSKNGKQDKAA